MNFQEVEKSCQSVLDGVAPAWDVRDFVAVNPFYHQLGDSFSKVVARNSSYVEEDLLPSKQFFLKQVETGAIDLKKSCLAIDGLELDHGLKERLLKFQPEQIIEFLKKDEEDYGISSWCISDLLDQQRQEASGTHLGISKQTSDQVSKWMASYFDETQSTWKMPTKNQKIFTAWKQLVVYDRDLLKELSSVGRLAEAQTRDAKKVSLDLVSKIVSAFDLNAMGLERYLGRLVSKNRGWAAFVKRIEFEAARSGNASELERTGGLWEFLAIQLCYDLTCLESLNRFDGLKLMNEKIDVTDAAGLKIVLLECFEDQLLNNFCKQFNDNKPTDKKEHEVQIAFCIDVRSEVIRRHIESKDSKIQTMGYAGFFGLPMSVRYLGHKGAEPQLPVLLQSAFTAAETSENTGIYQKCRDTLSALFYKKRIQSTPNSGFSFVEILGFTYVTKLVKAASGLHKPDIETKSVGLSAKDTGVTTFSFDGVDHEGLVEQCGNILRSMGLSKGLSKKIIFMGHGGESANNPYSSGLDCGACAGHNGSSNARALVQLLNQPSIRLSLKESNIVIPASTEFLAGWHNTTTDELKIFNTSVGTFSDLDFDLETSLKEASISCRSERARDLSNNLSSPEDFTSREFFYRANDWSEIRPEWGLSRNAFFYIGKREYSKEVDFQGRSFLHDYKCEDDEAFRILEGILTAPVVVANWINMQYFFSTTAPESFGSGDKILHNVVGGIGCISGNQSDLLQGLSQQSVWKDGEYFHEPVRLQVIIDAPEVAIGGLISKHQLLHDLVSKEWLKIVRHDSKEQGFQTFKKGRWETLSI